MPDDKPDVLPPTPMPAAGGEPLQTYIDRVLAPVYRTKVREAGATAEVSSAPFWIFYPSAFSAAAVARLYQALGRIDRQSSADAYAHNLYHLWHSRSGGRLPLAVRMAEAAIPDIEERLQRPRIHLPEKQAQLRDLFNAAKRRDIALGSMCDALRAGVIKAYGFIAADRTRTEEAIVPAWWADPHVVCAWKDGELRPADHAPAGTPHYRGVQLAPDTAASECGTSAREVRRSGGGMAMRAELKRQLAAGAQFHGSVDKAWKAVLGALDKSETQRGYSYDTFSRDAAGLLK